MSSREAPLAPVDPWAPRDLPSPAASPNGEQTPLSRAHSRLLSGTLRTSLDHIALDLGWSYSRVQPTFQTLASRGMVSTKSTGHGLEFTFHFDWKGGRDVAGPEDEGGSGEMARLPGYQMARLRTTRWPDYGLPVGPRTRTPETKQAPLGRCATGLARLVCNRFQERVQPGVFTGLRTDHGGGHRRREGKNFRGARRPEISRLGWRPLALADGFACWGPCRPRPGGVGARPTRNC
jgi:hypothetical protein